MLCSFIIPAYNASSTIVRCLDSIYALTLDVADFEVIIIDDCSMDNTIDIVEEYAKQYTNITLLRQAENHRQGAARNRGIDLAKGKYITFIDSDDCVEGGMIDAIMVAQNAIADILVCHYYRVNEKGEKSEWMLMNEPSTVVNGRDFMQYHYDWFFVGAPWGYLFKKSFIKQINVPFAEEVFTEDVDWIIQHLYYANYIQVCQHIIYCNNYTENSSSTGLKNSFRVACTILEAFRELKFAEKIKMQDDRFYNWLIEINVHKIQEVMKRLWKLPDMRWVAFYRHVYKYLRLPYIANIRYTQPTNFLMKHPIISIVLLYLLAAPSQLLKKIVK